MSEPKRTVLVVDDDVDLQALVKIGLEIAGFETVRALDGKEAMRLASQRAFDLVITDILMAPRDGFELICELRRRKLGWPIVVISGGAMIDGPEYLRMASAYDVQGLLAKPFTLAQLVAVVVDAFARSGKR